MTIKNREDKTDDIHDAIFDFLIGRTDAVVYGAHAVNCYVDRSDVRYTADVDLLALNAKKIARELAKYLEAKLSIKIERIWDSRFLSLFKVGETDSLKVADISKSNPLPNYTTINHVLVMELSALVKEKQAASSDPRRPADKQLQDRVDLMRMENIAES